ncbi:MAG: hypothetical protein AABX39_01865 [Nanoarchaeota archaeon]
MQEKHYIWLIFITVVLFAIIGLLFAKGNFLTGADVAEVSIDTSETEKATSEQPAQPSEEDELKKKQEMIEESFKNATSQAIKDVSFISCVEVRLHKNLPQGALKGVVQKMLIKINGHSETKVEGYPDRCSENGRKAIQNYCYNKQVLQREKTCETRCISGICV